MSNAYELVDVKFITLFEDALLPEYETEHSACADLRVYFKDEFLKLNGYSLFPGETVTFGTGLKVEIPEGFKLNIYGRSGMASKMKLALTNGVGIIDGDYPGELGLILTNHGDSTIKLNHQDRLGQIEVARVLRISGLKVKETKREDGFGHTGTK